MSWFKRNKKNDAVLVQTAEGYESKHPFSSLRGYSPKRHYEKQLYRSLREAVPVIDAAIYKIIRLTGGCKVTCEDDNVQQLMDSFLSNVRVNSVSNGIESFLSVYLDQLLTYGTAVGEIVTGKDGKIAALYNCDPDDVELVCKESPLDMKICARDNTGALNEVRYPELILCSVMMPEAGEVYGTSILRGLPFVSDILLKIFNAVGTNWDRVGNVRFAVTYKPQESDRNFSRDRVMMIADEWSKAMKSPEPRDFISVGDVSIKAIGADNQIPDSQIPVRLMLEQIIAKLSIPPFLLGLNWSSTERMSSQQADILTSELEYYRRLLEVPLKKICRTFLALEGISCGFSVVWNAINLQDEVELAKARLYHAQADNLGKQQ